MPAGKPLARPAPPEPIREAYGQFLSWGTLHRRGKGRKRQRQRVAAARCTLSQLLWRIPSLPANQRQNLSQSQAQNSVQGGTPSARHRVRRALSHSVEPPSYSALTTVAANTAKESPVPSITAFHQSSPRPAQTIPLSSTTTSSLHKQTQSPPLVIVHCSQARFTLSLVSILPQNESSAAVAQQWTPPYFVFLPVVSTAHHFTQPAPAAITTLNSRP
jgi:hypothetical protein